MAIDIKRQAAPRAARKKSFALISDETLKQLYASMLQCRMLDQRVRSLYKRRGLNQGSPSLAAHEAIAVGIGAHLRTEDAVSTMHDDAMLAFIKGASPRDIFDQLRARAARAGNGHQTAKRAPYARLNLVTTAPASAQFHVANGFALANKMQEKDAIVAVFATGAVSQFDSLHDALGFAAAHKLPALFVLHHDLRTDKTASSLEAVGSAPNAGDVPVISVDGNDVVAVYRVAQEAITRARQGGGPTLIEAVHFPKAGHAALQTATDPLTHMRHYLSRKGLYSEKWEQRIAAFFARKLDAAAGK